MDRFDVAAVVLLLAVFGALAVFPVGPKRFGDLDFHLEAKQLAAAVRGAAAWSEVGITKAPGPALYYLVPYLLVPAGARDDAFWRAGVLWNAFWMVVCLLLLRRAAEGFGGPLAGKIAVGLTLASPFSAYYSYGLLAEPPAYLGATLLLCGGARWQAAGGGGARFAAGGGLIGGGLVLLILSRPNAVLLLGIMALLALRLWRAGAPERRRAAFSLLRCIGYAVAAGVAALLLVRALPGRPGEVRQGGYLSHVVFHGRFQYRTEPWDWRFWDDAYRAGSADYAAYVREQAKVEDRAARAGISLSEAQWRWILRDWIDHPGVTLRAAAVRCLSLHTLLIGSVRAESFRAGPLRGRSGFLLFHVAANAVNAMLVLGTLAFLVLRRRRLWPYWVLWGPWLALLAFHALTYAEARYLFPSRPGLVVMTALVLASVLERDQRLAYAG
jgi:hypothetical protein